VKASRLGRVARVDLRVKGSLATVLVPRSGALRDSKGSRRKATGLRALQIAALLYVTFYVMVALVGDAGWDSHAYWLTRSGIHYGVPGTKNAYLYSPAFAQVIRPLTLLPWPAFGIAWSAFAAVTYWWLLRRVDTTWRGPLLALCIADVIYGNVWWLFALVCALGVRRPLLWLIPLFTKVTPAVGIIWFLARREWRKLAVLTAGTAVLTAVSVAISPGAWHAWIKLLDAGTAGTTDKMTVARVVVGGVVAAYAGLNDRPRLLPLAVFLAIPEFSPNALPIFAACARLPKSQRARKVVEVGAAA
jgi:hypothetical protein